MLLAMKVKEKMYGISKDAAIKLLLFSFFNICVNWEGTRASKPWRLQKNQKNQNILEKIKERIVGQTVKSTWPVRQIHRLYTP